MTTDRRELLGIEPLDPADGLRPLVVTRRVELGHRRSWVGAGVVAVVVALAASAAWAAIRDHPGAPEGPITTVLPGSSTTTWVPPRPVVGGGTLEVSAAIPTARLDFSAPSTATHTTTVDVTFLSGEPADVRGRLTTVDGLELDLRLQDCMTGPDRLVRCTTPYAAFPGEAGGWTAHLELVGAGPVVVELHVQFDAVAPRMTLSAG